MKFSHLDNSIIKPYRRLMDRARLSLTPKRSNTSRSPSPRPSKDDSSKDDSKDSPRQSGISPRGSPRLLSSSDGTKNPKRSRISLGGFKKSKDESATSQEDNLDYRLIIVADININQIKTLQFTNENSGTIFRSMIVNTSTEFICEKRVENQQNFIYSYRCVCENDDMYDKYFKDTQYCIIGGINDNNPALIIIELDNEYINGCVISVNQPTYKFTSGIPIGMFTIKCLKKMFPDYKNLIPLKSDYECFSDIAVLCQKFAYSVPLMKLGMLFAKSNQIGSDILYNKSSTISNDCKKFAEIMSVPDTNPDSVCAESYIIDDDFHGYFGKTKVKWYPGFGLSDDEIRQYVGNCEIIVIFQDTDQPFETLLVEEYGKVNKVFIIVRKYKMFYRVGVFYRNIKPTEPIVSENYLFDETTVRDYIFTKIYNCLVAIKKEDEKIVEMRAKAKKEIIWELIGTHNCRNM